jgi:hypothetical protein
VKTCFACATRAITLYFTPTWASSLNHIERWFALPADRHPKCGIDRSVQQDKADIAAFI